MSLDAEYLKELIIHGESERVEFKLQTPNDKVIAANLAAFANGGGGYLIIGVNEKGEIIGLAEDEAKVALARVRRVAASLLPFPVQAQRFLLDGKRVICAVVNPAPSHLSPIVTAEGQIFQRTGSTSRRLTPEEEERLLRGTAVAPRATRTQCRVFVAVSFRQEEEPALVDYYRAIERAVTSLKLPIDLVKMDLVEGDYEISQGIMDQIETCDVVIADFTLSPRNVYFELGFARGRGKEIIQLARAGTILEFDVRNWRTLFYRNATELEEKVRLAMQAAYAKVTNQT